jgi:hypothetical protein
MTAPDVLPLATAPQMRRRGLPDWPRYVIGLGLLVYLVLIISAVASGSFELLDPVPLIPLLAYLAYLLAKRVARSEHDPGMIPFVMAAFSAKMIGTLVRSLVVAQVYGNRSDSQDFHLWGKYLAPFYRQFDFSPQVGTSGFSGTGFMRSLTGVIYSFTGASKVSGSVFFSFLSFVGLLLLWRAFRRAVPDGAGRRYAFLVLFLPSMLYWPASLGKDAFAVFCLGVVSYGVARAMTGAIPDGVLLFAAGMVGLTFLRPHVGLTVFCGVVLAAAVGKSRKPGGKASILRLVVFGALLVLGLFLVSSTEQFFGVDSLNQETVNQTLSEAEGRTSEAGSAFTPVKMNTPLNAPLAFATVLFRPFPFEATSAVAFLSALEGVFLLVLTGMSWRRLRSIPRAMRNTPYVAYCLGIMFTFVYAFSAFSNFGILARQRIQVMPFFFVLLCLPVWERLGTATTEEALEARDTPQGGPYANLAPDEPPYANLAPEAPPYADAVLESDPAEMYPTVAEVDDPYARFTDLPGDG